MNITEWTPHEPGRRFPHPPPSVYLPIIDRPRRCPAQQNASIDLNAARIAAILIKQSRAGYASRRNQLSAHSNSPGGHFIANKSPWPPASTCASRPAGSFFGGFRTTAPCQPHQPVQAVIRNLSQKPTKCNAAKQRSIRSLRQPVQARRLMPHTHASANGVSLPKFNCSTRFRAPANFQRAALNFEFKKQTEKTHALEVDPRMAPTENAPADADRPARSTGLSVGWTTGKSHCH